MYVSVDKIVWKKNFVQSAVGKLYETYIGGGVEITSVSGGQGWLAVSHLESAKFPRMVTSVFLSLNQFCILAMVMLPLILVEIHTFSLFVLSFKNV